MATHFAKGQPASSEPHLGNLIKTLLRTDLENRYTIFARADNVAVFETEGSGADVVVFPAFVGFMPVRIFVEQIVIPIMALVRGLDVLHFTCNVGPFWKPCATVGTIHWTPDPLTMATFSFLKRAYFRLLFRLSVSKADRLIAVSDACKEEAVRSIALDRDRIAVIPHGVGASFTGDRPRPDGALPEKYFLAVTSSAPYKALPVTIRAFLEAKKRWSLPEKLVLAGNVAAEDVAGADDVISLGYLPYEKLPGLYAGATALIYHSLRETFGIPVVEAMAAGVPIVISDLPALREVAGDCALVVPCNDVAALAEAMNTVSSSSTVAERMIARGRERSRKFTWPAAAAATVRVYEEAARARRSRKAIAAAAACVLLALGLSFNRFTASILTNVASIEKSKEFVPTVPFPVRNHRSYELLAIKPIAGDAHLETYRKAIAKDPESATAWRGIGDAYLRAGRFHDAESALVRSMSLRGRQPLVAIRLGLLAERRGDRGAVVQWWKRAGDFDKTLVSLGSDAQDRGDLSTALRCFSYATELDPNDGASWLGEGRSFAMLHRPAEAAAALANAVRTLDVRHGLALAYAYRAEALIETARPVDAGENCNAATRLGANDALVNFVCANVAWAAGDAQRAKELSAKAIALDPASGEAYVQIAGFYAAQKDFDRALAYCQQGLRAMPGSDRPYACSGRVYFARGEYARAEEAFARACAIDPANPSNRTWLADAKQKAAGTQS